MPRIVDDDDDEVPPFPKTYLIVPYEHKDRAKQLGAKWDNDAKKWFADTAEAYYDLEEWHPANPTPGLTAKGRAESLYTLSRQLKQEADAILARERAMEQRRLGGKEAKPLPSPYTGKRKAEEPEDRFVTEWTWMKKLDASKPIKDREFVYNSRVPKQHRVAMRQTPEEYYAENGPFAPMWGSNYTGD